MATVSESSVFDFESLFQAAVEEYENQTGMYLLRHSLAIQLDRCNSLESITEVLQQQAHAFREFRGGNNKIITLLKQTVQILHKLSAHAALGEHIGLPVSLVKMIHTCLGILLSATKDVSENYDALVDLFESISNFLKRLDIYTKIPPTPATTEIIVKILLQLISTLAVATKQIKQGRLKKFGKKLLGDIDIEAVLHRVDRLTLDEARTTAAQTLEIVYGLVENMRLVISEGKVTTDGIQKALEMMQRLKSDLNTSRRNESRRKVKRWLSPPDPWENHIIGCETHHDGTARWFIEGETFTKWKSSPSSLLWIHGKPGSGKSIICSMIIENIHRLCKVGLASLAFYYFDFRDVEKKNRRGMLLSLLSQLCDQSNSYYGIISHLYSTHCDGIQDPSDDALTQCLKDMLSFPEQAPIYLILDALDECPNTFGTLTARENVLLLVKDLVDLRLPNLRICLTSRPEVDIKAILEPLGFDSISLHDEEGQKQDILNYVQSVVHSDPKTRRWREGDKQLVIDVLSDKANGMFRWVYCQFDSLRCCLPGRIRRSLDELPTTLDATYHRTLEDIDEKNWEHALRLFQCVAVASRPLRVEELAEFLAFDFKAGSIPKFHETWRLPDPVDAVLSTCSTLVSVVNVKGSPVVQFSHFSVKEYLTSARLATSDITCHRYHVSMIPAHTLVVQACLGILLHLDKNITRDGLKKYPLAKYAARNWVEHSRFENTSRNLEDGMKQLLHPRKPHFAIWLWIHDPKLSSLRRINPVESPLPPRRTPLHYAAYFGLSAIVELLVKEYSQGVNPRDPDDNSTPLHLASSQGHAKVARALLEGGADASAQDKQGQSPLHRASSWGHAEVVLMLLQSGVDASVQDHFGRSPLHEASTRGHVEVSRVLLEGGADPRTKDPFGQSPLHQASSLGNVELVQVLLKGGADARDEDKQGQSPLHFASSRGHAEVAQVLLEGSADARAQDKQGQRPLDIASFEGHVKLARVLLSGGANARAEDKQGRSPLHTASFEGHVELALVLLNSGADARAQDGQGQSPLHLASFQGHMELAQVLLNCGAHAKAEDKRGQSPLHLASIQGHVKLARLLLQSGAHARAHDKQGHSPLHIASFEGHVEFTRVLLNAGAHVRAQDKQGQSPLHLASFQGHVELTQVLLNAGADVRVRDKRGQNPLHLASYRGYVKVARVLLNAGADARVLDKQRRSALHLASFWGHVNLARVLLNCGADARAQDKQKRSPLHIASIGGHLELARVLLNGGTDASAQDEHGQGPLHQASSQGHAEVTQGLEGGADTRAEVKQGKGHRIWWESLVCFARVVPI